MTQSKTSCILFSTKWRLHNVASELWGQLTQLELSGENIHLLLFPLSLAIFPKHLFNIQYALCIDLSYKFSWSRLFPTFIKAYITVDPRVIAIKRISFTWKLQLTIVATIGFLSKYLCKNPQEIMFPLSFACTMMCKAKFEQVMHKWQVKL